jgi:hypothetical protein
MKKKNKGGRPTKMTPEIVTKLEYAFSKSFTDEQACFHVGISRECLNNYCIANPGFRDKKEALKKNVSLKAKLNVVEGVESGELSASKWWLERKNKEEFSLRVENTGKDGKDMAVDVIIKDNIQPKPNKSDTGGIQYKGGIK